MTEGSLPNPVSAAQDHPFEPWRGRSMTLEGGQECQQSESSVAAQEGWPRPGI
jgi:hypothetical protein